MPMRWNGRLRKRWRWVGAFQESITVFAASVEIGPLGLGFWGIWDAERRDLAERSRRSLPWRRAEIEMEGRGVRIRSPQAEAELLLGEGRPVECISPNGEGGYTWTRKLAGVPVTGEVRIGGRAIGVDALGVEDDSAGYHARRTSWLWSAGVGSDGEGRTVGWNLVSGINDPPRSSERAIWVDGEPREPSPVRFEDLERIRFADDTRLEFAPVAERAHREGIPLLVRSEYRAPIGSFHGSLEGTELASGLGVMESHDVLW